MSGVSIQAAKALAKRHGLAEVIVLGLAFEEAQVTVTTYGTNDHHSAIAAEAGNRIKRWLGWPEAMCRTESLKVARLYGRIAELESQLEALNASTLTHRGS